MARGKLAKRAIEEAHEKRSELYKWMRSMHADIANTVLVRGGWITLEAAAIEAGIQTHPKNGQGPKPPSIAALRSTWRRVTADMQASSRKRSATRSKRPDASPPPVTAPAPPARATVHGAPQALPTDDPDELPPDFPFVKERR
jgi:hypothetical protein